MNRSLFGPAVWLVLGLGLGAPTGVPASGSTPENATEGMLLVLNKHEDTLMLFDVPAHRRIATIKVGREPHEVAVTPDGRKAYVANTGEGSVSVVDLASATVVKTIRSERFVLPHGLAVTRDGRHLILTSEGSRRLFAIETRGDTITRSMSTTQKNAHMVAMQPDGRRAWVPNLGSDTVTLLKVPELRILGHYPVGAGPEGITVTSNGRFVLVALQRTDQLAILDASDAGLMALVSTGRTPVRVATTPNGFTALVANRGSDDLTVVDVLERRVRARVAVGRRPGGIAINGRGTRGYVCNNDSNSVSVVSIPGFEVTGTIEVGAHPDGIAFAARNPPVRGQGRGGRS